MKCMRCGTEITAGAVLLIVMLTSILVYQLISMKVEERRISELEAKIAEYNQMIEESQGIYDARTEVDKQKLYTWIYWRAKELGYILKDGSTPLN